MILTVLAGILMIVILVAVHELGHLLAARKCGVGVEQFAIGFGPGIRIFTVKGIPIYLRLIPLGGFVKLKSRELKTTISSGKYLEEANWLEKIFICLAGVGFNLILAVILRTLIFLFAQPDLQVKISIMTIGFLQCPAWYLAPIYAVKVVFVLFFKMYLAILLSLWAFVIPIIRMAPMPNAGIGGTIGLGANIHTGLWAYCALIYYVSIILAAANLLPLLPFDGGQIAATLVEKIFGQRRLAKILYWLIKYVGFAILILMMINLIMSDAFDIFNKFKGR